MSRGIILQFALRYSQVFLKDLEETKIFRSIYQNLCTEKDDFPQFNQSISK